VSQRVAGTVVNGTTADIDVKRFYLPGTTVSAICWQCFQQVTHDFSRDYLSYPTVNTPQKLGLYCRACEAEMEVEIVLKVSIEVVPVPR